MQFQENINAELNDLVISNPAVIQGLQVGFKLLVPLNNNIVKPIGKNITVISVNTTCLFGYYFPKKIKMFLDFQISNFFNL